MKNPFGDSAVDINDFGDSPFVEDKTTLADRNFNPGNLRFVGQSGAVEGEKGFAKFESYDAGYAALKRQISLDGSRGLKLGEFISKYAPSSENDTSTYQKFVAKQTGYDLESKVSELDTDVLAGAIVKQEGGSYGGKSKDVNPFGDAAVSPFGDEAVQEKSVMTEYKPVTPYTNSPNSFTLNRLKNAQEIDEKDYERMNRSLLEQASVESSVPEKGKFEDPMSVGKISYQQEPEQGERIEQGSTKYAGIKSLASDVGIAGTSGVMSVPEAAIGIADIASKGKAGKYLADELGFKPGEIKKNLAKYYSEDQQEAIKTVEDAEGFWNTVEAAVKNPTVIGQTVVESLPSMAAGGFVGRGVAALPGLAGKISPWIAGAIGDTIVSTGTAAEQIRQQTKDGELAAAQSVAAAKSGLANGLVTVVGGRIAQKYGFDDIDTMLASGKSTVPRAIGNRIATSPAEIAKRIFGSGSVEGFEELTQSAQEQIWQNAALDRPLNTGVSNAAALGFLSGVATGSGVNAVNVSGDVVKAGAQAGIKMMPKGMQTDIREATGFASDTITPWELTKESIDSLTSTEVPEGFTRVYRITTPGDTTAESVYTDDPMMLKKQADVMGITKFNIDSTDYELVGVDVPTKSVDRLRSGELKNEFVLNDEIVQREISSMKEVQGESSQETEMVEAESADVPASDDKFEPDKVFVSKKGNYYERVNGVWFDSEGEEVTDAYKLKAAEKGMRDYVAPKVEEEQSESAFGGVPVEDITTRLGSEIELEPGKGIEQAEQAAQITPESLVERVNQSTPDLDLKFDGVFDRTALNKTPLYQFTPQSGEFKGRTIAVDELSEEAVVGKLSGMGVEAERSKIDPLSGEGNKPQDVKFKPVDVTAKQFVEWFKESKAVTKDNKPERVFHGTADVFDTFEHDMPNKKDSGWLGKGFYFSNSPTIASAYTNLKAGSAPNIIPAYLSIQNPYYATMEEKDTLKNSSEEEREAWSNGLQSKGYDGVILESKGGIRELVAFDNTQIKSSISNTGEFSKKRGSILYSGVDPIGAVKGAMNLVKSATGAAANFLEPNSTGKLRMTGEAIQEALLDPERIMKRDQYAKKAFIALINAEESKNAFLYRNWEEYKKAVGGIKSGSKEAMRIGQALDGKLNPNELFKEEKRAYDFFKQNYEALITEYAQRTAGSKEAYERILNAVKTGSMKKTLVKDLVGEDKSNYWRLREEIKEVYKGRLLKDVTAEEAAKIDALKVEQRGILHNDWRKKLPENEANVYDILSRKVTDYLPRMFNPEEVKTAFMAELAAAKKALAKTTNKATETKLKDTINKYEKALKTMNGGGMVTFDQLPSSIFFKFFSPRVGKAGYSFDAVKAYESYLFGIAKKIFDEPAVKKIGKEYYDKIEDVSVKRYTNDLVRHYLGLDKSDFDWIAGQIATFEWMRTLGLNPRSALVNLSQRLNTVMYAGEKYSLLAQADMTAELASGGLHKSEASKAFDESGIAREVPNVMTEGDTPNNLEWIKSKVGFMFNAVELSNRKHAFIAGYLKAKAAGESAERCMQMGQKTVHKTQFRYGKLGMPKVFWNPIARVGMQFSSYTMKQAQFIYDLADGFKTVSGIVRFMKYVMYTQGIAWTLKEFLDADMSSAIGLNISWGDAMKGIVALVEGDWEALARHFKMTFNDGEGPVPGIAGPAVTGAYSVWEGSKKGEGMKALMKEVTPVILDRARAFLNAEQRKDGTWVLKGQSNNALYNLTTKQLVQRTLGPKSAEETRMQRKFKEEEMLGAEKTRGTKAVIDALLSGDKEKFRKAFKDNETAMLVVMSQKGMFEKMVEAELMKRKFTQEELERFKKKPSSKQVFNTLRKGET